MDNKFIVYTDMDGPLANFSKAAGTTPGTWTEDPPCMFQKGFFRNLEVMPGAKEAIATILTMPHVDLFIASKPTSKNLYSATEKYQWIEEYFPPLLHKIFLTCDKGHLNGHVLIDDYLHWASRFQGIFLHFDEANPEASWKKSVEELWALKDPQFYKS